MAPPKSTPPRTLKALIVYRNFYYLELIRSVHVYEYDDGVEKIEEREFVFHHEKNYEETMMGRIFTNKNFQLSEHFQGRINGIWECIYMFDIDTNEHIDVDAIPAILSVIRNPKLENISNLAEDLEIIYQLAVDDVELSDSAADEGSDEQEDTSALHEANEKENEDPPKKVIGFDLNLPPPEESDDEEINLNGPGSLQKKRKSRAAHEDVARLTFEDIAKHFDVPIVEAAKNLKVGLTVLKKKCREFGIPFWPRRKIRSLN